MEKLYEFQENLDNLSHLICRDIFHNKSVHIHSEDSNRLDHIHNLKNCFHHHKIHPLKTLLEQRHVVSSKARHLNLIHLHHLEISSVASKISR